MRAAPFIQWGCGGGERTNERGRIPPLLVSLPILLPISLRASSRNPCVPPPTPPHSLRSSPQRLLTVLACQCGTGAHSSKAGGGVEGGRRWRCRLGAAFGLVVGFWAFDGVRDIEGGCASVFDGVWGVEGGWGAVFDRGWVVEGGWSAGLGCLSSVLGFRRLSQVVGGGLAVSTASAC